MQANRNGYFYVLDRTDGKFLRATPYLEQVNWATIDDKGRPVVNPDAVPKDDAKFRTCPSNLGGMNGSFTGALDPDLGIAFIPSIETCQVFSKGISAFKEGLPYLGGSAGHGRRDGGEGLRQHGCDRRGHGQGRVALS